MLNTKSSCLKQQYKGVNGFILLFLPTSDHLLNGKTSKGQDAKVQNGSLHQKETVHDNDFEPYLTGQSNPVRNVSRNVVRTSLKQSM
uniref:Uncharacterized protein n=1 Tax=Sinocyclocheilus rhinocerous TaxID=307959 RepID=A0A673MM56_9TELE